MRDYKYRIISITPRPARGRLCRRELGDILTYSGRLVVMAPLNAAPRPFDDWIRVDYSITRSFSVLNSGPVTVTENQSSDRL